MIIDKGHAPVNWFKAAIDATLVLALIALMLGLYLRFQEGGYEYVYRAGTAGGPCPYQYVASQRECVKGHNAEWTAGENIAEWSLTYLGLIGGIYGLVLLLGNGRLRTSLHSFWHWFWRGDAPKT